MILVGDLGERLQSKNSAIMYMTLPALHGATSACATIFNGGSPLTSFLAAASAKLSSMYDVHGVTARTSAAMISAAAASAITGSDINSVIVAAQDAAVAHLLNDEIHMTRHGPRDENGRPVEYEERSTSRYSPGPDGPHDPRPGNTMERSSARVNRSRRANRHGGGTRRRTLCPSCRGRCVINNGNDPWSYKACPVCSGKGTY